MSHYLSTVWNDIFVPGVPLLEKTIRTLVVYGAVLIGLRLAGKRELSQLNPFDLVVLLLLSNTVQNAIIGNDNSLLGGLLGAAILLAINYVLVRAAFMSPRFGKAIQGGATLVVDPCVPRAWRAFDIVFRYHSARYDITVENPRGVTRGVTRAELDGEALRENPGSIPLTDDGAIHRLRLVLGRPEEQ